MSDPRQYLGSWDVVAGDPLSITLTVLSSGSPVNLTTIGSSWASKLRQSVSQTPSISFTVDATNAATGVLVLSLAAATTTTMTTDPGASTSWTFDLQCSGGTVTPQTMFEGNVVAWRPYTHA